MTPTDGWTAVDALPARPPPEAVRSIGLALLDELSASHARGVVHRDLRPATVLVAPDHAAVRLGAPAAATVSYLAPEQLAFLPPDARADLWAVGVMLYELLAGVLPYRATKLGELMSALALSEPVPIGVHLPNAGPTVQAFFARALARDRAHRFASAREMARALAATDLATAVVVRPPPVVAAGEIGGPVSRPLTPVALIGRDGESRRVTWPVWPVAIAIVLAILVGAVAVALVSAGLCAPR